MKKKEIRILKDFKKSGLEFHINQTYIVSIIQIGFTGESWMNSFGLQEGHSVPSAIVEFENGKVMHFDIDIEIHIVGNAE